MTSFPRVLRRLLIALGVITSIWSFSLAAQRQPSEERPLTFEEYEPKSTLVVPEHLVPRARYPVVDVHSHHRPGFSQEAWERIISEMDQLNLQVLVNLSGGSGQTLRRGIDRVRSSRHPDRMVFFANLDFTRGVTPGFGARAAAALEEDVRQGAVGLKLFKEFGLEVRDGQGQRVHVDDPELIPVWETAARLDIPVLMHVGEPMAFFDPVDRFNERWMELIQLPDRRLPPDRYPGFEEIMAERDRLFARHPKTRFIVAHMGWHANDLGRLGRVLDRLPNVSVETGAILYELGRQPHGAREFFIKYQDRVLFGKDRYEPSEFPYYWRVFETRDEYFDYYRRYHAFWKLYGLDLPDEVLKKVYYQNALRVIPGIPRGQFPRD